MDRCEVCCPICKSSMDWMRGYGRECRCCSKECHQEFERRRAVAIMGNRHRCEKCGGLLLHSRLTGYVCSQEACRG